MESEKDGWDKLEILGKLIVGLAVPIAVATTAYLLNNQISKRAQSAEFTRIAVGVLQSEPNLKNGPDHLRIWAIEVLRNPQNAPPLSDEAAQELRTQELGMNIFELKDFFGTGRIEQLEKFGDTTTNTGGETIDKPELSRSEAQ